MAKAFFHKLPTVLCKIVGIYEVAIQNKVTGKRLIEQVSSEGCCIPVRSSAWTSLVWEERSRFSHACLP